MMSVLVLAFAAFSQDDPVKKDVERALKNLASEKYSVNQDAHAELVAIGREAVDELVRVLREEMEKGKKDAKHPAQLRHSICEILGAIRDNRKSALDALVAALDDKAEYGTSVASSAAGALGWIGDRSAAPALLTILKDSKRCDGDRQLKYECIRSLGLLRHKEAAEALRKALEDKKTNASDDFADYSHLIAAAAAEALGRIRAEDAYEDLGKLLNDNTQDPFTQKPLSWHIARSLERISGLDKGNLAGDTKAEMEAMTAWRKWYETDVKGKKNAEETKKKIEDVAKGVQKFKDEVGRWPTVLEELISKPTGAEGEKWKGPYVTAAADLKKTFHDAWDRPMNYRQPGTGADFDVYSYGADGRTWGAGFEADLYNHDKWIAAKKDENKKKHDEVLAAIAAFKADNEKPPMKLEDLWIKPNWPVKKWEKPYIAANPRDAYDNPFIYRAPGTEGEPFDLISVGPDRVTGGTGVDEDLWNHSKRPKEEKKDGNK